jgi:hypothetical protein
MSVKKEIKSSMHDVGIFILGLGIGTSLDYLLSELHSIIHPYEVDSSKPLAMSYLVLLGLFQIFINIIIIHISQKMEIVGGLFMMGLFIPQSVIITSIYGTPYVSQNVIKKPNGNSGR